MEGVRRCVGRLIISRAAHPRRSAERAVRDLSKVVSAIPSAVELPQYHWVRDHRWSEHVGETIRNTGKSGAVEAAIREGSHEEQTIHTILDAGFLAHVGFSVEGQPFVI